MEQTLYKIKCPHCGAEYTLDEIFIPKAFFGRSSTVVRDALGKILTVEFEEDPDYTETYNCDYCKKDFTVTIEPKIKSDEPEEILDFSKKTVSLFD